MKREVRGETVSVVSTATARLQQFPVQNIFILPSTSHYNLLAISPHAPSQRGWGLWLTWLVISGRQIKYLLNSCSNLVLGKTVTEAL